ncbi:SIS domain-containing protein (plasmid) [Deinococcus metallilatus]|nr:SIS domain-containing protein [Deinococcus metallilatus]QBY07079.1 SIS domain-containing protein [Deinococcus metallilatus]RXJ18161.1 SIS domain-containing protein [Deinococcus metallilatus]TLK32368.1 SIS domain-containing protein [Deinococcus metallilatus]
MSNVERSILEQFPLWQQAEPVPPYRFGGRLVAVGCGTSYYLAQTMAATFNRQGQAALAVPGNEWVRHQQVYVTRQEKVSLLAVSRSGESTETVQALRASREAGLHVVGVTCEQSSTLAREADTVVSTPTHPAEGIVMTASASLMLLQGLRLAGLAVDGNALAASAEQLLHEYGPRLDALLPGRTHFVFLGAAELHGLAQEGALKLQEMSLSFTQAYHPLEYRHGPVSLVDQKTLVALLYHPDTAGEEAQLARELQDKGARVLGLGGPGDLSVPLEEEDAARRGLTVLPLLQWFGQRVARSKGIDSEQPRHLTKVVSLA